MDVDTTIKNLKLEKEAISKIFNELILIDANESIKIKNIIDFLLEK